ncbi:YciI family protein [Nocardia gamkensis]|uniref:YciI family protein n=1 Tax=Nocardia gamkensis TaxID=352869 RepID=UPI0037C8C55E
MATVSHVARLVVGMLDWDDVAALEGPHQVEGRMTMTQYLLLIYQDENLSGDPPSPETGMAHQAFIAANGPALRGGNGLECSTTATTVRVGGAGDFMITDGPFAETKEQIAGYYLIDAADLDAAIALARQVPMGDGCVEVRPIRVVPGAVG